MAEWVDMGDDYDEDEADKNLFFLGPEFLGAIEAMGGGNYYDDLDFFGTSDGLQSRGGD